MAPHTHPNPAPMTESARKAAASFYCDLCDKGYARADEFSKHEMSYDHQHNERRARLKDMQKKTAAATKKTDENLMEIKPINMPKTTTTGGTGFKKAFKSAFAPANPTTTEETEHERNERLVKKLQSPEAKAIQQMITALNEECDSFNVPYRQVVEAREDAEKHLRDAKGRCPWDHARVGCVCGSTSEKSHMWFLREKKWGYFPWLHDGKCWCGTSSTDGHASVMRSQDRFKKVLGLRDQEEEFNRKRSALQKRVGEAHLDYHEKFEDAIAAEFWLEKQKMDPVMREFVDSLPDEIEGWD